VPRPRAGCGPGADIALGPNDDILDRGRKGAPAPFLHLMTKPTFPRAWIALSLGLIALSCGGGGGGDGGEDPPPPPPYAEVLNTHVAVAGQFDRAVVAGSRWLLAPVSENEMGTDLNGDGDLLDIVATLVDTRNDTTTSLGLALAAQPLSNGEDFAFLVSEQGQNRTDLSGDGDAGDAVWFVLDPAAPLGNSNPYNLGIPTPALGLSGAPTQGAFVLLESELAAQQDLTADGDLLDVIPVAVVTLGTLVSTYPFPTVSVTVGRPLVARSARVLMAQSEAATGFDLNGDGDTLDNVLAVIDFTQGIPVARLVGFPAPRAVGTLPYALTDRAAVYFIDEAGQGGFDINADGDSSDAVVAVYDLGGGGAEFLPITPSIPSFGLACDAQLGIVTEGDLALFAVVEADQGNRDLTGDLDTFDVVPAWVNTFGDPGRAYVGTLALSRKPLRIGGGVAVLAVSEFQTGTLFGVDLNGDGDADDDVLHFWRLTGQAGTVTNLAVSVTTLDAFGRDVLAGVSERGQHGDLNGDGDTDDVVLYYYDVGTVPARRRPLGLVATSQVLTRDGTGIVRLCAIAPESQNPGLADMTGDGDLDDLGSVLVAIDPAFDPPRIVAGTPFEAGAASFFTAAPLAVGFQKFAWPASEAMANADLDDDGDRNDTVIRYLRVVPPG